MLHKDVEARLNHRKEPERSIPFALAQIMKRHLNISATNPLAIKIDGTPSSDLRSVESTVHVESEERKYLSFQYFTDSECTELMLSTSQQLNKCAMDGWESISGDVTATYNYNTLNSSGNLYVVTSSVYAGHCISNGSFKTPIHSSTQSFPMTCTAVGSLWGMTVVTASLPTYPNNVEALVYKYIKLLYFHTPC
jgi:hypothetical protein